VFISEPQRGGLHYVAMRSWRSRWLIWSVVGPDLEEIRVDVADVPRRIRHLAYEYLGRSKL
jgi:hypothetical protein